MTVQVAALFVDAKGVYPKLLGAERCWDVDRDARAYAGAEPVVAHPPCARWSRLAPSVFARTGKEEHRPAWLGGTDGGCFAAALAAVRKYGGVLEHPADSHAWTTHGLLRPGVKPWRDAPGWYKDAPSYEPWDCQEYYVCEVWQSAYGHKARKRTWLLYCGKRPPFELRWDRKPGTHIVGQSSKRVPSGLPRLTGRENCATPERFARELIRLAEWSRL